ncbi:hypothetical protein HK105_206956 [Polyrhizophydium stewartii]|uniref:Galactose oxidase-like Early set domain-containing protein n=1 Tax=Polyrhizophydium stewartii TaxID=2732419 RepID=A0ABR4N1V0_9FUNG
MTVLPMTIKNNFKFTLQICGGSRQTTIDASPMCWQISPEDASPQWTRIDDMPRGRLMIDSVIMPDGKILYLNGGSWGVAGGDPGEAGSAGGPIMAPDLFDPEAPSGSQWSTLASASNYRMYHSGALLLETGHIVTFGSDINNQDDAVNKKADCMPQVQQFNAGCQDPFNTNIERFAPPYLQRAERNGRPVISKAPDTTTHNSTFIVELSTAASNVARVTFIRQASTTHQTNTDQRFIELNILGRSDKALLVQAPDLAGRAPPGRWFLFVLDKDGVPSVAKTVFLQLGAATQVPAGTNGITPSGSSKALSRSGIVASVAALAAALAA